MTYTPEEQKLLTIFAEGNIFREESLKRLDKHTGAIGLLVEEICKLNGFDVKTTGVDIPKMGIEIKTRKKDSQSATNWGSTNQNDIMNSLTFYDSDLFAKLIKQLRIVWKEDYIKIDNTYQWGGVIVSSKIIDLTDPMLDYESEFRNLYEYAKVVLHKNPDAKYIRPRHGVKRGDVSRFYLERNGRTNTFQVRSTETQLDKIMNVTHANILNQFFQKDNT